MFDTLPGVFLCPPDKISLVDYAKEIARASGLGRWEELSDVKGLPGGKWMVMAGEDGGDPRILGEPLVCLAILELSSPVVFSRVRPAILTEKRLGRKITLWRPRSFFSNSGAKNQPVHSSFFHGH